MGSQRGPHTLLSAVYSTDHSRESPITLHIAWSPRSPALVQGSDSVVPRNTQRQVVLGWRAHTQHTRRVWTVPWERSEPPGLDIGRPLQNFLITPGPTAALPPASPSPCRPLASSVPAPISSLSAQKSRGGHPAGGSGWVSPSPPGLDAIREFFLPARARGSTPDLQASASAPQSIHCG